MSEIRLDPIARTGQRPRKRPPPRVRRCACGDDFRVTVAHRTHCSYDCAQAARERRRVLHVRRTQPCAGCGRKVTVRFQHCYWCRKARQEAVVATQQEAPPNPGICGLPMHGGRCQRAVDDGTDSNGRATLYCPVHGERYAPVTRPPWTITEEGDVESEFLRYDQRPRFQAAIAALKVTTPVDPEASRRAQGRTAITIAKRGNFVVRGRDAQRKFNAA